MTENPIELDMASDVAGYCDNHARQIEREIEHMGVALGIDWDDEVQVRLLAREALEHLNEDLADFAHDPANHHLKAKITLFGLANMMLILMARSAGQGVHTHGGAAWKAFSRALRKEKESQALPQ